MPLTKIPWNIPNILSVYRLLSMPFIVFLIFSGYEIAFVTLFIINQVTDILDGYLARRLNMVTEIGSILDSWADLGSYIIAICGIIKFHNELFSQPYASWLIIFVFFYCLTMIVSILKFRKVVAGLHLYSSKINGYLQGSFLIVLFLYKLIPSFFYVSMIFGILAEIECITIHLLSKTPVKNAKGIYWFLKNRKHKL